MEVLLSSKNGLKDVYDTTKLNHPALKVQGFGCAMKLLLLTHFGNRFFRNTKVLQ